MAEKITYKLESLSFDGPLDLLLTLIEKNKFNIFDIPIFELTRQYAEYVSRLKEKDLEVVSEFLLMAATLLEIKTKMLLPKEKDENGEELDPREELVERLLEYKKYRYLAGELSDVEKAAARFLYRDGKLPEEVESYRPPLDLGALFDSVTPETLRDTFEAVLRRKEYRSDSTRKDFGVIRKERVSLGKRIRNLVDYARRKRRFSFREMLAGGSSRTEVVVSFLAVLELMKMGRLTAEQDSRTGEISLSATGEIDRDDLELEDIVDA